nr:MAG TPA: Tail tape measure chaperone protein [Caudoviricetes sp.]
MYTDLLSTENGNWSLSEINEADYTQLLELFTEDSKPKKEKKQDAMDFFGTFMNPAELQKAKGTAL